MPITKLDRKEGDKQISLIANLDKKGGDKQIKIKNNGTTNRKFEK